jgi:hypothetical protein
LANGIVGASVATLFFSHGKYQGSKFGATY